MFRSALLLLALLGAVLPARAQAPAATRRLVARLTGDYVHPAFSASGRYLALSEVLVHDSTEGTQIVVLDLDRHRIDTLLPAARAARYATYKSFVSEMAWRGDSVLVAVIPDGDVDAVEVGLRRQDGKLLWERYLEPGLDPQPEPVLDSLASRYPELGTTEASAGEVLASVQMAHLIRGPGYVVLQRRYHGAPAAVTHLDLREPRVTEILPLLDAVEAGLVGGFAVGDTVILAAGAGSLTFYRWAGGAPEPLLDAPCEWQKSWLTVLDQAAGSALLHLRCAFTYEDGDNYLFQYARGRLCRVLAAHRVGDAAVSRSRRLLALTAWSGGRRRVVVEPLPRGCGK